MSNEDVMKLVLKKFPTCTIIDASEEDGGLQTIKCNTSPQDIIVGQTKKRAGWDVTICMGSFNVYVLTVTPRSENAE
jgi:hypothetical protein